MNIEVGSLFKYVVTSSERLFQAVTDEMILDESKKMKILGQSQYFFNI